MEFTEFTAKTHAEISDILIKNLQFWREEARQNQESLSVDSRSVALRNRGKEISRALTAITNLLEDLGIDVDEIDESIWDIDNPGLKL